MGREIKKMALDPSRLPTDTAALRELLLALDAKHDTLLEQVRLLYAQLYGRRSEQRKHLVDDGQLTLFDQEPDTAAPAAQPQESSPVSAHTRKKPVRKVLPEFLPRLDIVHDLTELEKICGCGTIKDQIGQETSERLDIIPARAQVLRDIRLKYVCPNPNCDCRDRNGTVITIPPPPPYLIPKGIPSNGTLAHITTSKFVDGLPLYRQEAMFLRMGIHIKRTTMCGWIFKVSEACAPLLVALRRVVLSGPLINVDETTIQVLKEKGRLPSTKSYMWVFRGGPAAEPAIEFLYDQTRGGDVPRGYFEGYQGAVQSDDYVAYDFLDGVPGIDHLGCWSHARRKFVDVCKATGKPSSVGRTGIALDAITQIAELYRLEDKAASMTLDQRRGFRREQALPRLEKFQKWLGECAPTVPPKSLLGKAIRYVLHQWDRLVRYVDNGLFRPDNNLAENAIRPFVVGRKNWLFSDTPAGAEASACLYSLVETAKANGLDPYWYLRYIFNELPYAASDDDHKSLLPQYVDKKLVMPYHRPP